MKKQYSLLLFLVFTLLLNCKYAGAQWTYAGPDGGFISNIAASGDDLYATSGRLWFSGSGFYRSTDKGYTWEFINSNIPADVRALIVKDSMLFIGTGTGVYCSDDGGNTWVPKNTGLPSDKWINHLAVCGNVLFAAGTTYGMMISKDNGEHWTAAVNGLTDTYIYSMTVAEDAVFVGTGDQMQGVFRSDDFGNSWQQVVNGMAYYNNGNWVQGMYPVITALGFAGNTLYAGTGENQGIWKSDDLGQNWTFTGMETMNYAQFTTITGTDEAVLAGTLTSTGVIRTKNGGASWTECNAGIDNYGMVSDILILGTEMLVSTQGGIYRTADQGSKWSSSGTGLQGYSSSYPSFAVKDTYLFWSSGSGGVFRSADQGSSWENMNNGLPISSWNLDALYSTPSALFAWDRASLDNGETWQLASLYSPGTSVSSYQGPRWIESGDYWFAISNADAGAGVWRSEDRGLNWTNVSGSFPSNLYYFEVVELDATLMACTSGGLYCSTDKGNSWTRASFPDFNTQMFNGVSFIANNSVFICGLNGGGGRRGICRSTDGGATWSDVGTLLVRKLYTAGNKFYATGTNLELVNGELVDVPRLFMSADQGATWSNISLNVPDINTLSFLATEDRIFIATYSSQKSSLYCSADDGATWIEVLDGLPNSVVVSSMFVLNGQLFAGTHGFSLWKRALADFGPPLQPDTIAGPLNPCAGSEVTYSISVLPGVEYSWQVPAGWIMVSGNGTGTVTVVPGNTGGLVLITPSNAFGAGPAQYIMVAPVASAEVQVQIAADLSAVCEGERMEFTATATNEGSEPVYSWRINGAETGENAPQFGYIPVNGDTITLLLTSSVACAVQNPVFSNEVIAEVNGLPVVSWAALNPDTLCIDAEAIVLTSGLPLGGIYSGIGVTGNSPEGYTFLPSAAGEGDHAVVYTYVDPNGCTGTATGQVTVNLCTGMPENTGVLSVYPNPAGDHVTIALEGNRVMKEVYLFSSLGTIVGSYMRTGMGRITLSLRGLASGIYTLRVVTDTNAFTRTIIKR